MGKHTDMEHYIAGLKGNPGLLKTATTTNPKAKTDAFLKEKKRMEANKIHNEIACEILN